MKILPEFPPFYNKVLAAFPEVANTKHVLFTYGEIIYNPAGDQIPSYTVAHEEVHNHQQATIGKDEWWHRYLEDPAFRFEQEIEAYRVEYRAFCKIYKDRNERNSFLKFQASMLSSPMYGSVVTTSEARVKIST